MFKDKLQQIREDLERSRSYLQEVRSLGSFSHKTNKFLCDLKKQLGPKFNKIPCVVLIYYNTEIIKLTIDYLLKYTDFLEIYIVENRSIYTNDQIKPYILNLVNESKIKKYFLFQTNISSNAIEVAFSSKEIDLGNSEYILLTDGDLLPTDDNWLSEQIQILVNHPEVFCCNVDLEMSNLPVESFPEAITWIPQPSAITESYLECLTGLHFSLMRVREFVDFLKFHNQSGQKFVDGVMHKYCYSNLHKKWAKTKRAKAKHLTWDLYNDLEHPYTRLKISKPFKEIWLHEFYSCYEVYGKYSYTKHSLSNDSQMGKVFDLDPDVGLIENKLHIGCGQVKLAGWVNIDESLHPGITDVQLDITKGLPYDDNSCSLIHHEHFLEHLSAEAGLNFLKECYRVLKLGGVMRIAMPSLDLIIEKYYLGNWKDQDWLKWPEYQFIQTRAEMLNISFRWWGHQWLYDREELHRRLQEAGFTIIRDVEWGNSDIPELRKLETRKDSLLICEAEK
ncbi:methyltransferase domain-containing protein [Microcoleus sp. POL10_C6]|uniref:methyltransferase domain-containing protein n=1 Tax=Microcoleus sp. POL10_C6 TaxID=2818852 RepID=UPI002FD49E2E